MHGRGLGKESLEVVLLFDLPIQSLLVVARQPADDLVDFFFVRPLRSAF
jgi:hypothetical protein